MADPESCFKNALSTISVHANSVWWHEGQDSYRLANLSLWLDHLRSRAPDPSAEEQAEQSDTSQSRSNWNPLSFQEVDYPESYVPDPEAWLRGHAWPTAIARNFPAITAALSSPDRPSLYQYSRVLEKMYEANKPYKIETLDEMRLYRKTSKESIKKIWAKPETTPRKKDPSLNANVPEFYPSVLFHHVDIPQSYPPITDHTYHMELFPYHEQNAEPETQWQVPQLQVYPSSSPENFPGEWRGRPNNCSFANLLLLQKAQKGPFVQGGQTRGGVGLQGSAQTPQQRHPFQVYVGPSPQPQQQQILLNSDFPELPTVRGSEPVRRPTGFPDICTFAGKTPEEMAELNNWLQTAYPQRAAAFADLAAATNVFEEMARRACGLSQQETHPQQGIFSPSQNRREDTDLIPPMQTCQEPRRLYRDVLASKGEDDSETTLEGKFEELEREAIEQYISSENSGEVVEAEEPPQELEDPYQDLERQAVEQYDEPGDMAGPNVKANSPSSTNIFTGPTQSQRDSSVHNYTGMPNAAVDDPILSNKDHKNVSETNESKVTICTLAVTTTNISSKVGTALDMRKSMPRCATESSSEPRTKQQENIVLDKQHGNKFPPLAPSCSYSTSCKNQSVSEQANKKAENTGLSNRPKEETKDEDDLTHKKKGREWRRKKGRRRLAALNAGKNTRSCSIPLTGLEEPGVVAPESRGQQGPKRLRRSPSRIAFDGHGPKQTGQAQPYSYLKDKKQNIHSAKSIKAKQSLSQPNSSSSNHESTLRAHEVSRQDKKESRNLKCRIQKPPVIKQSIDAEVKTLISSLKIKALNFLKEVEKKPLNEEKLAIRELLYGSEKEKIREQVVVSDIQSTDTFKAYVKEVAALTRQHMECIYRRVRNDVLEMKTVYVAQPTTAEKRKVRYLIKKCIQLQERAEYLVNVKKLPKKPLEAARKEISDTLNTIHKTMDIVYRLRDMCRECREGLEQTKMSRHILSEVIGNGTLLDDQPLPVRERLEEDYRSLLLYLLCPKGASVLHDRVLARLEAPDVMYARPLDMAINNYLLYNEWMRTADVFNLVQIRFQNTLTNERSSGNDIFDTKGWNTVFIVGKEATPVNLIREESVKQLFLPESLKLVELRKRIPIKEDGTISKSEPLRQGMASLVSEKQTQSPAGCSQRGSHGSPEVTPHICSCTIS